MRQLLAFLRSAPAPLDQDTADRLLAGRLAPEDAPPGYDAVAKLLAAAAAAPSPDELAGEQEVVAEFTALTPLCPPGSTAPRAGGRGRRSRVKAAALVAVALLSIGGIAVAATGRLWPAAVVADREGAKAGRPSVRPTEAGSATATPAATTRRRPSTPAPLRQPSGSQNDRAAPRGGGANKPERKPTAKGKGDKGAS